jgi:hypothetical protein
VEELEEASSLPEGKQVDYLYAEVVPLCHHHNLKIPTLFVHIRYIHYLNREEYDVYKCFSVAISDRYMIRSKSNFISSETSPDRKTSICPIIS